MRNRPAMRRALVILGTGVLLASQPGAEATPKDQIPTTQPAVTADDPMRQQEPQRRAAEVVDKEVGDGRYPGFVSIALEPGRVVVWWHGSVPARIRAVAASAERFSPVVFRPARYPLATLEAAADRIAAAMEATPGGDVRAVSVLADGSGLKVTRLPTAQVTPATARTAVPAVEVPVSVVEDAAPEFTFSRNDDTAPWWGGAKMDAYRDGRRRSTCTSGWSVHDGHGNEWILTAAHCGTYPDVFEDPLRERVGQVGAERWDRDILLIITSAQGRIYDGPVGTSSFRDVTGWANPYVGELFCHSGAYSGTVCQLRVDNELNARICATDSDGDWTCASGLIGATRLSGARAVTPGDSGGPVYITSGAGVAALGIISAGNNSPKMYFQDFNEANNIFGVVPTIFPA